MSVLLLTMGPQLGITADLPVVAVGGAGVIRFRAIGAVGPVKWTLVDSTLPAEWDTSLTANGDEATLSTADALQWGDFEVTVRAVDDLRQPVVRIFKVWVEPAAISITGPSPLDLVVGVPVTGTYAITGGTGDYVSAQNIGFPESISVALSGPTAVLSGTPSVADVGAGSGEIIVTDSRGAQGVAVIPYEVKLLPKILIGGDYSTANGVSVSNIARFNADGTLDTTFSASANNTVRSIVPLSDGRIFISGNFVQVNGVARNGNAILEYDGSLTSAVFPMGGVVNGYHPLSSGKIICVGNFTAAGMSRMARLNPDYTRDSTFTANANNQILCSLMHSSGKLLIGGNFSNVNGVTWYGLACIDTDGVLDPGFSVVLTSGNTIFDIVEQADGSVLVGGTMTQANGVTVNHAIRLNPDLTLDTGYTPTLNTPQVILPYPGGSVYGGGLVLVNGSYRQIVAITSAGVPVWGSPAIQDPYTGARMDDGTLIIGGYNGYMAGHTAAKMLSPAGSELTSPLSIYKASSGANVYSIALQYSP